MLQFCSFNQSGSSIDDVKKSTTIERRASNKWYQAAHTSPPETLPRQTYTPSTDGYKALYLPQLHETITKKAYL